MYPNIPGPCNCPILIVDPPGPAPCTDCLYARGGNVFCTDSISPFSQTAQIPITVYNCESWTANVLQAPKAFETAGFNVDNMLQVTTNPLYAVGGQKYDVYFRVICNAGDHAGKSVVTYSQICVKNLCAQVSCPPGQVCNPATGECEAAPGELIINGSGESPYGGLQIQ